jgi:pimeloyl-ACP methyl ester carboxylesterase
VTFPWIFKRRRIGGVLALALLALAVLLALGYATFRREFLGAEGRYFEAQGIRMHYTDEGQGAPLVLLHGLAIPAHAQWRRGGHVDALAKSFRVITMDLRGHGRSDAPQEPAQYGAQMVEDVVQLLDHLGIDKAHVAGYSLGGLITLKLTALHPERLLSASVCAAGWGGQRSTAEIIAFREAAAKEFERGSAELILTRLGGYIDRPRNPFERLGLRAALHLSNDTGALAAILRNAELDVTEAQLRANTVPVLGIIGDQDGFLPDAIALHECMAQHQLLVLPGMTHASAGGAPDFLPALIGFLRSHTPAPVPPQGQTP